MVLSASGKITLAEFKDTDDYRTNIAKIGKTDLIIINSGDRIAGFNLYPTKIELIIHLPAAIDRYWQNLPGRLRNNLKRKYRRGETQIAVKLKFNIAAKDFLTWYERYRNEVKHKPFGRDVVKNPAGYFKNHQNLVLGNILGKDDGKVIGGAIMALAENQLRYKLAWYSQEARKHNAGYYLVLECIKWAINHQLGEFSFGRDTNLYGGHLSLGLHQFKTAFASRPVVPANGVIKNIAVNPAVNRKQKPFLFYTLEGQDLMIRWHQP